MNSTEQLVALLQECREFFAACPNYDGADTNNLDTRCLDAIAAWSRRASINSVVCEAGAAPEIDRDSDGELLIDWAPGNGRMLSMTLREDGRLSYAFTWDGEKAHGTAQMPPPPGSARDSADLPVKWKDSEGATHEISLDYAAQIAKWMFDTYGDVPQVDAVLMGDSAEADKTKAWGVAQERCERARDGKHEFAYQPALGETICTYCGAGNRKAGA